MQGVSYSHILFLALQYFLFNGTQFLFKRTQRTKTHVFVQKYESQRIFLNF